jgi:hypothetical protein
MRSPWTLRNIYCRNRAALTPEETKIALKQSAIARKNWRARKKLKEQELAKAAEQRKAAE